MELTIFLAVVVFLPFVVKGKMIFLFESRTRICQRLP